ncbi:hypothetical protein [Cochleicola gelatinilyticus]|uniref:Glycosyltransferase RgtA/B/C/D-like domain-containing protein n=1 Tax=Cochleicola gelatinilyticus TaxID=1763537 RepID=A0A167KEI1_9FLAO|nr:hypothetical protein [Cochleicola gelatinilyticus]OAB81808.1 hypothetical protein ULVI_00270 [Cochleicola gelatinilyticus]
MGTSFLKSTGITTKETYGVVALFFVLTIYFILQPPIYSPDTYSYFNAIIFRYPGYVIFLRGLEVVFKGYFDVVAVACQLVLGWIAVFTLYRNCSSIFSLILWQRLFLVALLIVPYFPPLSIGNNLASEGISYPLYLLLMSFSFDMLFIGKYKRILHFSIVFLTLTLTRGQFIVVSLILAFALILKERNQGFKKKHVVYLFILLALPVISKIADSTYRKAVHGFFVATPFSYSNALTLPLYVSKASDSSKIENKDYRNLFVASYKTLDSLGLTSRHVDGSASEKYKPFHENVPIIFNQNYHKKGGAYFLKKDSIPDGNILSVEAASKTLLPILIKNNPTEYRNLYFAGMIHGFKSVVILIFVVLLVFYSLWETFRNFTRSNGLLLFSSLLLLSNSMLVAFASHSIARYLFYNYFFALLIGIVLFRKITKKI